MPRKTTTTPTPKPDLELKKPTDNIPAFRQLEYPERQKLLGMLNDPVFIQAWQNAEGSKPNAFPAGTDGELGGVIANNRLHQIQGWEMFKAALLKQVIDPRPPREQPKETYPDSALP
jgi:hypothetical protein